MAQRPVEQVRAALRAAGIESDIVTFSQSTRTAADAAAAIGTSEARIVKSLVFLALDEPILALVSGPNRVDTRKLSALVGAPIKRADAEQARAATGFVIGGIPPVGHVSPLRVYVDHDLLQWDQLWAAAGTPNSVFAITPDDLLRISGGTVVDLRVDEATP